MEKVKIPKDIREYKEKFLVFTYREWGAILATIVIPYFLNRQMTLWRISPDIREVINWSLVFCFGAVGFWKYAGMTFEKLIFKLIQFYFGNTRHFSKKRGDIFDR
ncbi:MAG: hypothetical protein AWU54_788 [Candidatus Frackibacter sp. T328-2]|nr:MAG: hypothetical protein AWU54_788 [Candidatus Frackibacter sp. T328-2]